MKEIHFRQQGKLYFGWWVLLFCFILMAVGYAGILTVGSIFVVPITEDLGIPRGSLMVYVTVLMISSVFFTKLYSAWISRGGRSIQQMTVLNAIAVCVAFLGFSRATTVWVFYAFALLLGSGFAALSTLPVSILINNWFGGRIKGTMLGLALTGSGFGGLMLAPIINRVIEAFGWRQGYVVLGLLILLCIAPTALLFARSSPEEKGFYKMGMTATETRAREVSGLTYEEAKRKPYYYALIGAIFLVILGSGALISNAAAYYIECDFSSAQAAAYTGYMSGALIVGKLACGMLCDKKGAQFGVSLCFGLYALCFLQLFLLPRLPFLIWGILITYGFGCGATTAGPPLLISSLFGEKAYGPVLGNVTMTVNLSIAVAGFFAAQVYDFIGSYAYYWLFSAVGSVLTVLLLTYCYQRKKRDALESTPIPVHTEVEDFLIEK